jgi:hypothetical protein
MREPHLVQMMKSFTKDELKDFEKFIASPYFNKGRNLTPYLKILIKILPGYSGQKHNQEFFRKLYPGNLMTAGERHT